MTDQKKAPASKDDAGQGEVKDAFAKAQEQGYFGQEVDPTPNEAFSIKSGPDSPTITEQRAALAKKEA